MLTYEPTPISRDDTEKTRQRHAEMKGKVHGSARPWDFPTNYNACSLPPASVIKQLAMAVEAGKKFKTTENVHNSAKDSERSGLSFSAMKSLVTREKEAKATAETSDNNKFTSFIGILFNSDTRRGTTFHNIPVLKSPETANLLREIHGAPLGSFICHLSAMMGSLKNLRQMASFWKCIIKELKQRWSEEVPIPYVPPDDALDLNYCLLHQQMQVINCCISRKRRRKAAVESLEFVLKANSDVKRSVVSSNGEFSSTSFYAKTSTGDSVLRLGVAHQSETLTMLETSEPIYSPVMQVVLTAYVILCFGIVSLCLDLMSLSCIQEGPLLTEDLIRENEELVLRTGSVGVGCSQLLSDMQAFKAANPGCILEDFIRWHSPPDWTESDSSGEIKGPHDRGDSLCRRGQLSRRMQKEGNLWRELWDAAKSLPAVLQTPLFDEELAVEGILKALEEVSPAELFEQLFISILGAGIAVAESALTSDNKLSELFYECKDYIVGLCHSGLSVDALGELCQVYETMEAIILHPEGLIVVRQSEELKRGKPKGRFAKFSLRLPKEKQFFHRSYPKELKKSDRKQIHAFTLFHRKSLFSVAESRSLDPEMLCSDENG